MGKIQAVIKWECDLGDFSGGEYSRKHIWEFDGGLRVPASSSPDIVPVPHSDPSATDPEEAFVAAISSCHMLWFLSIAANRGYNIKSYIDNASGVMGKNAKAKIAILSVTLNPKIEWQGSAIPNADELKSLHDEAHERCFIANSVGCDIVVAD